MSSGPLFSSEVNARIYEAHELAGRRGETHSDVAHLLAVLVAPKDSQLVEELMDNGNDIEAIRKQAASLLPAVRGSALHGGPRFRNEEAVQVTQAFMDALDSATSRAQIAGDHLVNEIHLYEAIQEDEKALIGNVVCGSTGAQKTGPVADDHRSLRKLKHHGRILTEEATAGLLDPVIGRTQELRRLMHVLGRRRKNNPVLLGEPGVGKTAIVEGLAQAIVEGTVPSSLSNRHIFALDIGSLVAGTKYRGEFESRMQDLLDSIRSSEGRIILFIDEVHLIARAGGAEGAIDAASFLKPMLARGEVRAIGATTVADYRLGVVGDGALERRFQPIHVREPTEAETLAMLRGLRLQYERYHGLRITDEALNVAVTGTVDALPHRHWPDKAIDLVDEAASRKRTMLELGDLQESEEVLAADVLSVLDELAAEHSWTREIYDQPDTG